MPRAGASPAEGGCVQAAADEHCAVANAGFVRLGRGRALCEARSCRTGKQQWAAVLELPRAARGASPSPGGGLWVAAKNPPVILQHPNCETM